MIFFIDFFHSTIAHANRLQRQESMEINWGTFVTTLNLSQIRSASASIYKHHLCVLGFRKRQIWLTAAALIILLWSSKPVGFSFFVSFSCSRVVGDREAMKKTLGSLVVKASLPCRHIYYSEPRLYLLSYLLIIIQLFIFLVLLFFFGRGEEVTLR